jgi:hypothetical protein
MAGARTAVRSVKSLDGPWFAMPAPARARRMCCDAGMDFDAYERKLWAGRAGAYERGFARLTAYTAGALLDAAGVEAGTRLLDAVDEGQVALPAVAILASATR